MHAALHALANETEFSVPGSTAAPRRKGDVHADGADRRCEKAPRVRSVAATDPSSYFRQFRPRYSPVGIQVFTVRHTRCGRRFRGREAAAPDPPADRYGRKVVEGEGSP